MTGAPTKPEMLPPEAECLRSRGKFWLAALLPLSIKLSSTIGVRISPSRSTYACPPGKSSAQRATRYSRPARRSSSDALSQERCDRTRPHARRPSRVARQLGETGQARRCNGPNACCRRDGEPKGIQSQAERQPQRPAFPRTPRRTHSTRRLGSNLPMDTRPRCTRRAQLGALGAEIIDTSGRHIINYDH